MFEFGMKMKRAGLQALVLAGVGLGIVAGAEAAPVTFGFEATVDSISPGASFDSEIGLEAGDVITGRFTFEPNARDGSSPFVVNQPYAFSVDINGVELSTAAYMATSRDDAHLVVDCTELLCPGFAISDALTLGENGLLGMGDTIQSNLNASSSGFQMQLEEWFGHPFWGGMDVLDAARIPADIGTWNQFSGRSLQVWLEDIQGGAYRFNATVGQFTVVPEPCSGFLICIGIIVRLAVSAGRKPRK